MLDKEQPKLTPTAIFESSYLTQLFTGKTTDAINYPPIPTIVFTSPQIAQVGMSVEEAQQNPDSPLKLIIFLTDGSAKLIRNTIGVITP